MSSDLPAAYREFAVLLRQRRRAARLTQLELADRAGLSVRTVREAERGRTVRPHRTTVLLLADALALAGAERARFLAAARAGAGSPGASPGPAGAADPVPGLPAVPVLFGRRQAVTTLAELVTTGATGGPVTLVGLAGVGKSVLALAVAHRVAGDLPGGVARVPVTRRTDAAGLLAAAAAAFGVPPAGLADHLADAPALLLLDGVDLALREVRSVLARLPAALQVIATGRAPLDLPTERVWPVTPLPALELSGAELAEVTATAELPGSTDSPAVALFRERLSRVRPGPLSADEVPALVELVRRVGGLPSALELLAGHARVLELPQLLRRYGHRLLDIPVSRVDRRLRHEIAVNYHLLSATERAAVRWLAEFRGRWSVELAEQQLVAGDVAGDPVPLLDRLMSLGLMEAHGPGEHRLRLVPVIREFGTERARRLGETVRVRRAHVAAMVEWAERISPLPGPVPAAVARLDESAADLWSALSYATNHDPPAALRLAARLVPWWRWHGRDAVGRRWLHRLLADDRTVDVGAEIRAWAMTGSARLANGAGEGAAEQRAAESALVEFQRLRDVTGELTARRALDAVYRSAGWYDRAREQASAGVTLAVAHGRWREAALAQLSLVWHELRVGDPAAAGRRLAVARRSAGQAGDVRVRALVDAEAADLARLAGRYGEAVTGARRALEWWHRSTTGWSAAPAGGGVGEHRQRVLGVLGLALAASGRSTEAADVLTRLRAAERTGPSPASAGLCALLEGRLASARGDRAAAAGWYRAAATASAGGEHRRQLVEALVELVGCSRPDRRSGVRAELARVCREGGFTLLPRQRALLAAPDDGPGAGEGDRV